MNLYLIGFFASNGGSVLSNNGGSYEKNGHLNAHDISTMELDVLSRLAEGQTTKCIAAALSLTPPTIQLILESATRKLNAKTTIHAVALLLQEKRIPFRMQPLERAG